MKTAFLRFLLSGIVVLTTAGQPLAGSSSHQSLSFMAVSAGGIAGTYATGAFRYRTTYPAKDKDKSGSNVFSDLKRDFRYLIGDPAFYGVVGSITATPFFLKNESTRLNRQWTGEGTADHVFEWGDAMGNPIFPVVASGVALAAGHLTESSGATSFGSDLLRSHFFNAVLTLTIKRVTNRQRPDGTPFSFPSGHTSTAFTSAGVIWYHLGPWWGVGSEIAASYVGLSRIQENKHYVSDVIAGAVLGSLVALEITHRSSGGHLLRLSPIARTDEVELGLEIIF